MERCELRSLVVDHLFPTHVIGVSGVGSVCERPPKQELAKHEYTERIGELHRIEDSPSHVQPDLLHPPVIARAHRYRDNLGIVPEQRVHLFGPLRKYVPADQRNRVIALGLFAQQRSIRCSAPAPHVLRPLRNAPFVISQRVAVIGEHPVSQARQLRFAQLELVVLGLLQLKYSIKGCSAYGRSSANARPNFCWIRYAAWKKRPRSMPSRWEQKRHSFPSR